MILLASPLSIADVGLWLTFGATAAIVAGVTRVPLPSAWWLRGPAVLLVASLSAEVVLMPIGAFIFQRVTLAGLSANLVAVPCMAVAQVRRDGDFTAADAIQFEQAREPLWWVTHLSAHGLLGSAALVDWAPWLTWRVALARCWAFGVVTYYLAVVMGSGAEFERAAGCSGHCVRLFGWIAIAAPTLARRFGDGRLHLTMLDVGTVMRCWSRSRTAQNALVDAGGVSTGGRL